MHFSENVDRLVPSATLELAARARALKDGGRSIVDLTAGEPSFPTPEVAAEAAHRSVLEGHTGYPPTPGIPTLRRAIAAYLNETTAAAGGVGPERILVSAGVKQALFNVVFCLFGAGDEVLVPAPCWPTYVPLVELARATPVVVPTRWEKNFRPEIGELDRLRTERTRAVLVNSPNNPTGAAWEPEVLEELCAWAERHDLWLISDEIYRRLAYTGSGTAASVFDVARRSARVVLLDGISKAFSMPGWRLGFATGPAELIGKAAALQSQTTSAASAPAQYAAAALYAGPERETIVEDFRTALDRRRRLAFERLREIEALAAHEPEGALYLFPRLPEGEDSTATAERLLDEQGLACIPGDAFGAPGHLRMNFAVEEETLVEGMRRLAAGFGG